MERKAEVRLSNPMNRADVTITVRIPAGVRWRCRLARCLLRVAALLAHLAMWVSGARRVERATRWMELRSRAVEEIEEHQGNGGGHE